MQGFLTVDMHHVRCAHVQPLTPLPPPPRLQGFHKILKKHDKAISHAPCRQFYVAHLHQQPWVQGNYSDLLVQLSNVYSKIRGDTSGQKNEDMAQVGDTAVAAGAVLHTL
jgi:hypothetical protein